MESGLLGPCHDFLSTKVSLYIDTTHDFEI